MKGDCMMHMRNHTLFVTLSAALLLSGLGCSSSKKADDIQETEKEEGQPKIQAVQADFDFGKVKQGVDVEHVFKVKNVGTKDLFIEKARGS